LRKEIDKPKNELQMKKKEKQRGEEGGEKVKVYIGVKNGNERSRLSHCTFLGEDFHCFILNLKRLNFPLLP